MMMLSFFFRDRTSIAMPLWKQVPRGARFGSPERDEHHLDVFVRPGQGGRAGCPGPPDITLSLAEGPDRSSVWGIFTGPGRGDLPWPRGGRHGGGSARSEVVVAGIAP